MIPIFIYELAEPRGLPCSLHRQLSASEGYIKIVQAVPEINRNQLTDKIIFWYMYCVLHFVLFIFIDLLLKKNNCNCNYLLEIIAD